MDNNLLQIVNDNFGIKADNIKLISNHSGSIAYLIVSKCGKYVLKKTGHNGHRESGGLLTEYLCNNGIRVAKLFRTVNDEFAFCDNHYQYTLQEFIDGEQIPLNSAPDWFMQKYVKTLGEIQNVLKNYKLAPLAYYGWPRWLLSKTPIVDSEKAIGEKIDKAKKSSDFTLAAALNERMRHIRRVSAFDIDIDKLSHTNSHGDYYLNQIIVKEKELVVIDWDSGGHVPACFEVMMAFTYADPICKSGVIDVTRFEPFLAKYLNYTALSSYDIRMMPYFTYLYLCFCGFTPPYDNLPTDYLQIAKLSDNLMNWLHDNVDNFSVELSAKFEQKRRN